MCAQKNYWLNSICPNRTVLSLFLKVARLIPGSMRSDGREFHEEGARDGECPRTERRGETSWNAKFTRRCRPKFRTTRNGCDRDAVFDEVGQSETVLTTEDEQSSTHSLYVIREAASSQWSRSRIKVVTWSLYCSCRTRQAAALITPSRRLKRVPEMPPSRLLQ